MIEKKYKALFKTLGKIAEENNLNVWVVGGAVRDFYLKRPVKDIDITVEGDPAPLVNYIVKKYGVTAEKFEDFGTYRINIGKHLKLDFVRARKEVYPEPGALPVVSPGTIKEDLFRRDFTANAWALSIMPDSYGASYDPYGSKAAIDGKYIQILHNKSFDDDPTRLFRAVRFAGRFNWDIEENTSRLMKSACAEELPLLISRDRIRNEFIKILQEKKTKRIFELLSEYGLERFIYYKFKWTRGCDKTRDYKVRLGILACNLKERGGLLLRHLYFKKEIFNEVNLAWELSYKKLAPLKPLTTVQRQILLLAFPKLPRAALRPCFITGGELEKLGYKGERIALMQNSIRALQYAGGLKSKEAALRLLTKPKALVWNGPDKA